MKTKGETNPEFASLTTNGAIPDHSPAQLSQQLQTILVPVQDLSDPAKKALRYSIPFARQMRARIIFLHILPVTGAPAWKYDGINHEWFFDAHVQRDTEHQLSAFAQNNFPRDVSVEIEVRYGAPTNRIVETAREMSVDLIIMCTHAHRGWVHALLGSVASDVVQRAPCPVLVVREHEHEFVTDEPGALATA